MRRTILTSFVIIGAALAVVFGGGTFSAFNDVEDINGEAESAIFDIELSGDGVTTGTAEIAGFETLNIDFDNVGATCGFTFFAPGGTCTIQITLTRPNFAQQLAADLVGSAFAADGVLDDEADGDLVNGVDDIDPADQAIEIDCDGVAATTDGEWHISWVFVDLGGDIDFMPAYTDDPNQRVDITVSLDNTDSFACQNVEIDPILLTITANQATPDPHDTTE